MGGDSGIFWERPVSGSCFASEACLGSFLRFASEACLGSSLRPCHPRHEGVVTGEAEDHVRDSFGRLLVGTSQTDRFGTRRDAHTRGGTVVYRESGNGHVCGDEDSRVGVGWWTTDRPGTGTQESFFTDVRFTGRGAPRLDILILNYIDYRGGRFPVGVVPLTLSPGRSSEGTPFVVTPSFSGASSTSSCCHPRLVLSWGGTVEEPREWWS